MAKQAGQKLKLLYLLDILREYTDDEHGLGLSQIQAMLQKQMRLEKQPDRKSLYDDFASLEDYGVEVMRDENNQYHLLDREFQLPEVKLLIDSIQASKFLSSIAYFVRAMAENASCLMNTIIVQYMKTIVGSYIQLLGRLSRVTFCMC